MKKRMLSSRFLLISFTALLLASAGRVLAQGPGLPYHGGPVIPSPHVVFIFWGPTFSVGGSDYASVQELISFRNRFGTTPEYNTITQYAGLTNRGALQSPTLTSLGAGTPDWVDPTPPSPTLVPITDSIAQEEVKKYFKNNSPDGNTIYEIILPSVTSTYVEYAKHGSDVTCGGNTTKAICGFHGSFYYTPPPPDNNTYLVRYSVQGYPNCYPCSIPGFSKEQSWEVWIGHETREAVNDPDNNLSWYDSSSKPASESDDKCSSTGFFIGTGGYGYQPEWSNALNACTRTTPIPINPVYEGYFEAANCRYIAGWAWSQSQPNAAINVDIDRDSVPFTSAAANLFRSDLLNEGIGNGYHGFSWMPGSLWKDGQWHTASVRFSGTNSSLTWSPSASFICNLQLFPGLVPQNPLSTGGHVYTVATQFSSSQSGTITDLGFYRASGETDTNILSLWNDSGGAPLVSAQAPSVASCPSGWCWAHLSSPVAITAGASRSTPTRSSPKPTAASARGSPTKP